MATPRVLRLECELRVPEGLRANIQSQRVQAAAQALTVALQSAAASVFPWADQLRVRWSWSYEWWADDDTIALAVTDKNTVDERRAGTPTGPVVVPDPDDEDGAR